VVKKLLEEGHSVKVIVRSEQRLQDFLTSSQVSTKQLTATEKSLLDLPPEELQEQVSDADAVVSCLGHNMTFQGIWGHPRRLVSDATQRLTQAMAVISSSKDESSPPKKFVLMGSDGVPHPLGTDDERVFSERVLLSILRNVIPPHYDNELAVENLVKEFTPTTTTAKDDKSKPPAIEWVVVRPTDLIDDGELLDQYTLYPKPQGSLFGSGQATRSNVARAMVDLVTDKEGLWGEWKYQMPVLHDKVVGKGESASSTEK